jgi:beta-glucosidase
MLSQFQEASENRLKYMKFNYIIFITLFIFINNSSIYSQQQKVIYHSGWIDFNKNGIKDIFEDPTQTAEKRINNLLSQMNLAEKTCQLATLYGYGRVLKDTLPNKNWKTAIWKDGIGNIDEHLNNTTFRKSTFTTLSFPYSKHAASINTMQKWFIEETRLGIPVDFTNEGIHGLAHDRATLLPAPIALGSTWNKALINKVGHIVGREAKALGYTNVYTPILDLARDPRWGRVVECFGEDPFLVAELGKQVVLGVQEEGVASTLKHFAVYSVPNGGRDGNARTDPHVTPRELHDIFLYPFRRVIQEAKPMGVMSSYNDWNGEPVTGSYYFLTELLRTQYGFDGYVVSDSDAVEFLNTKHHVASDKVDAVKQAFNAGLNVRTNFDAPDNYILPLRQLMRNKEIDSKTLNSRVADVLRVKFKLGLFDQPLIDTNNADKIVNNEEAKAFSKVLSKESIVLLKNENDLLPIKNSRFKKILITGPLADDKLHSMSRYGPNNIQVVSVLEGFNNLASQQSLQVSYEKGCEVADDNWPESELYPLETSFKEQKQIDAAVAAAIQNDVIVAVMGETEALVGESRSRTSLELPGNQLKLLQALFKTGKPIVLVLINGRPLTINWANKYLPSIIEAWFPGEDGGNAIADVIWGNYNPGGKLPVTFPKSVGQLEYNFPYKPGAHAGQPGDGPNGFGKTNVYGALYPFGFGLSYTKFKYSNLIVSPDSTNKNQTISISIDSSNAGNYDGDEVVQLYFKDQVSSLTVYEKQLRGFERVHLKVNETKKVRFELKPDDFKMYDKKMNWVVEPGVFEIMVGTSSEEIKVSKKLVLTE